jgi:hypothetical protein
MGMVARYLKTSLRWNTRLALIVTYAHKSLAYMVLITSFFAIWTGLHDYRTNKKRIDHIPFPIETINGVLTLVIVAILELKY